MRVKINAFQNDILESIGKSYVRTVQLFNNSIFTFRPRIEIVWSQLGVLLVIVV